MMDMTTTIFLLLIAALAVALYRKKGKPLFPVKTTENAEKHENKMEITDEDYRLVYTNDNAFETKGPAELFVTVSDATNPRKTATSTIYHDVNLISDYITIGRDNTNTYMLNASNIDRYNAIYLAKIKNTFQIRANPESRNGLSESYLGERIENVIQFTDSLTLFMGNLKLDFVVPGYEAISRNRRREDIFSDTNSLRRANTFSNTASRRKEDIFSDVDNRCHTEEQKTNDDKTQHWRG